MTGPAPRAVLARRALRRLRGRAAGAWRQRSPAPATGVPASEPQPGPDDRALPRIPVVPRPQVPVGRPDLTVAVILDPFSEAAFGAEWRQVTFNKGNWRAALTGQRPDLLFVESAWTGNRGKWQYTMASADAPRQPLRELVSWCREQRVPTVFWNKEDPPNYERFLRTAQLFDYVFTVDADCLARYRQDLGHDRVGVLPFAAQPRIHNPIRSGEGRPYDVAFAGTFFAEKHPRRREQMATVLEPATHFDLHIYSRMQEGDERYQFPERYAPYVVGTLPYDRMLSAYKAYKVFLNVNSVIDSPSTCARRVFELSACGTPVVSGWSRGIEEVLGDRIAVARTPDEARDLIAAYLSDDDLRDREAHRAQRLVLSRHTYAHRVDSVLRAVGLPVVRGRASVSVVVSARRSGALDGLLANVARQEYRDLQLVVVSAGAEVPVDLVRARAREAGLTDVRVVEMDAGLPSGACRNAGTAAAEGSLVATMEAGHWYGPHYLTDLVQAFDYTGAGVVGKQAHYVHLEALDATVLRSPEAEHRFGERVHAGTMVVRRELALRHPFPARSGDPAGTLLDACRNEGAPVYAADRFNFVELRRGSRDPRQWPVTAASVLAEGGGVASFGPPQPLVTV